MKCLINRFPYLHKVDKILINLQSKDIELFINGKYEAAVKFSPLRMDLELVTLSKHFKIDKEILKKIMEIIENKDKNE